MAWEAPRWEPPGELRLGSICWSWSRADKTCRPNRHVLPTGAFRPQDIGPHAEPRAG